MVNASFVFGMDDDGPDVFERTVAWITGRHHIRELIPFPRLMNRLSP